MTMALHKAACIINSACTTKPHLAGKRDRYMPHLREWREPSTYISAVLYEWLLHDRPEGERHGTHILLSDSYAALCQMEGRAWKVDPKPDIILLSPSRLPSLLPKERANKKRRDDCWMRQSGLFIPKSRPTPMSIFTKLAENYGK